QFLQSGLDLVLEPGRPGIAVSDPEAAVHAVANRTEGLDSPRPHFAVPEVLFTGRTDHSRRLAPGSPAADDTEGPDSRNLVGNGVRIQRDVCRTGPVLVLSQRHDALVGVGRAGDQGLADQPGPVEPVLVRQVVSDPVGIIAPQLLEAALAPVVPPVVPEG